MIRVFRICRKCGAKIFSDAPRGLCTACVLETALGNSPHAAVVGGDSSAVALAKADDSRRVDELSRDETSAAPRVNTTARAVPVTSGAAFASSAFAEAAADESPAVTKSSAKTPSAVSSMQPVQSPFGESEKIFAPHFRQILITRIIVAEISCFTVYCVKFGRTLRANYSNEMTQFVFNIARSGNRVGDFLAQ